MPNWCNNFITITGPEKKINQIQKHTIKGDLLNYFMPMPKELNDTTSPSSASDKPQPMVEGYDNWYDWRVHNWGTKWDIDVYQEGVRMPDPETIQFSFDSAWAPPIGAYEAILDKHDDIGLVATYYEPGCDFAGEWDNGDDSCISISEEDDNFFKNTSLGKLLDDEYGILESREQWREERNAEVHNA